jgi:hypothetical protein
MPGKRQIISNIITRTLPICVGCSCPYRSNKIAFICLFHVKVLQTYVFVLKKLNDWELEKCNDF